MFFFKMQLSKLNFFNLQITKCCIDAFEVLNILLGDNCIELEWSVRSALAEQGLNYSLLSVPSTWFSVNL